MKIYTSNDKEYIPNWIAYININCSSQELKRTIKVKRIKRKNNAFMPEIASPD